MTSLAACASVRACCRSSPRISSEMRLSPPPMIRFICELPPEARVVMMTPGMHARQLPVQIARDLLAASACARPCGTRRSVMFVRLAPPPMKPPPPAWVMTVSALGHQLGHHALEPGRDVLRALDARADRQFRRHADFTLVRLRHQLEADRRQDQHRRDDGGHADAERPSDGARATCG